MTIENKIYVTRNNIGNYFFKTILENMLTCRRDVIYFGDF